MLMEIIVEIWEFESFEIFKIVNYLSHLMYIYNENINILFNIHVNFYIMICII